MEAPIESALTTLANQMIPRLERSDDPEQDEAFRMNKPEGYVLMTPEAFEMNNLVIRQSDTGRGCADSRGHCKHLDERRDTQYTTK
jgi:hypothetical protein